MNKKDPSNFSAPEDSALPSGQNPIRPPDASNADAGDIYDIYYDLSTTEENPEAPDQDDPEAQDEEAQDEDGQDEEAQYENDPAVLDEDDFLSPDEPTDDDGNDAHQDWVLSHFSAPSPAPAGSTVGSSPAAQVAGRFDPAKKYSFSRTLAAEAGVDGAMVLFFLALLTPKSTRPGKTDKKPYIRTSSKELGELFPWKGRRAWSDTLQALCKKGLLIATDEFRASGIDQTFSYTITSKSLGKATEDPVYFLAGDAALHGVCAAVLLNNLRHFLRENLKESGEQRAHAMKPGKLEEHLNFFSRSSIKRALDELVKKGVITRHFNKRIRASEFAIPGYVPDIQSELSEIATEVPRETVVDAPVQPVVEQTGTSGISFDQIVEKSRMFVSKLRDKYLEKINAVTTQVLAAGLECVEVPDLLKLRRMSDDKRLKFCIGIFPQFAPDDQSLVFEIAVIGLRRDDIGCCPCHGLTQRAGYDLRRMLSERILAWEGEQEAIRLAKREKQIQDALAHFSPDAQDATLPAAQKAKLFRSMMTARHGFGVVKKLYPNDPFEIVKFPVAVTGGDKIAIQRFFAINISWTSSNLFEVVQICCELQEWGSGEHDPQFYARHVKDNGLKFLFENLEKISSELAMTGALPPLNVYEISALYPSKGEAKESE